MKVSTNGAIAPIPVFALFMTLVGCADSPTAPVGGDLSPTIAADRISYRL